jgi:alkylhydroperoxidase family enzyme
LARRLGATEEWISANRPETPLHAAAGRGSLDGLDEGWRTALEFAELVTESGHAVDADAYGRLAQHWNDAEIVEITLVAGLFSYFNRFNDALRVEITK